MSSPKISIIVPVYKVEKYLRRCLDSIVSQTFTDWECILVDDGSPDNSGEMCDEYADKDKRFRVFHQENAGVSAARNKGLDEAKGEWIGFVDSDDWIEKEMYEFFYTNAIIENADVVCCGVKYYKHGKTKNIPFKDKGDIFYKFQNYRVYMHSLCNKLIKRKFISGRRLNTKIKVGEDLLFVFDVFTEENIKIVFYDALLYFYFQENENSSIHLVNYEEKIYSLAQLGEGIYAVYKNKQMKLKTESSKRYLDYINYLIAIPYIELLDSFNPDKFRQICKKWNFGIMLPVIFLQTFFVYIKFDWVAKVLLQIKTKIRVLLYK